MLVKLQDKLFSICRGKKKTHFEICVIYSRTDEVPIRLVKDVSVGAPCLRNVNLNLGHIVHSTYKLK